MGTGQLLTALRSGDRSIVGKSGAIDRIFPATGLTNN